VPAQIASEHKQYIESHRPPPRLRGQTVGVEILIIPKRIVPGAAMRSPGANNVTEMNNGSRILAQDPSARNMRALRENYAGPANRRTPEPRAFEPAA